jgi:hypothetical protein
MHGLNDPGQELSCLSHKGSSLNILIIPGPFTDEHQFRLFISLPKDDGPSRSVKLAPPAIPQFGSDVLQR